MSDQPTGYNEKGAPAQYPPAGTGQYPPAGTGQYPPAGTGQYPPAGTAPPPQYSVPPPGGAPYSQYSVGTTTQAGYVVQAPPQTVYMPHTPLANPPNDYMVPNILGALFCCLFIGIFGVMKSNQCQQAARQGRLEEAQRLSGEARRLSQITFGVGIAVAVCYITGIVVYYAVVIPQLINRFSP